MFRDFENILNFSLTLGAVLENIVVALICSLMISILYRWTHKGPGYSLSFLHSLVILSMITAIVIMVIGNNLARAFGLVGAMSIIRFRTPIKEAMDIVYIFFALAIGMAAGVGLHSVAFLGTIIVSIVILIMIKSNFLATKKDKFLLQINFISSNNRDKAPYLNVMDDHCKHYDLINVKSVGESNELELSYFVDIKNRDMIDDFIREMREIEGVLNVNLYYDDQNL